jgi:hypothetical protein
MPKFIWRAKLDFSFVQQLLEQIKECFPLLLECDAGISTTYRTEEPRDPESERAAKNVLNMTYLHCDVPSGMRWSYRQTRIYPAASGLFDTPKPIAPCGWIGGRSIRKQT